MPTRVPRAVRRAGHPQNLPVVLAVVVLVTFGAVTTVLGLNAVRAAHPCPLEWRAVLLGGPAFVVVVSLLLTLRGLVLGSPRSWLPAVAGSVACILLVGIISAHLHVA